LSKLNNSILKRTRELNDVLANLIPDNFTHTADKRGFERDDKRGLDSYNSEDGADDYDKTYPRQGFSKKDKRSAIGPSPFKESLQSRVKGSNYYEPDRKRHEVI
jgi:hypothetical protein